MIDRLPFLTLRRLWQLASATRSAMLRTVLLLTDKMTIPSLNLIWCQPRSYLWEEDWIRWLVGEATEHYAPDLDCFPDYSLFVLSGNYHPLKSLPPRFKRGLAGLQRKGLFHLSDEWFSGGYEVYSHFDFVLRNHDSAIFSNRGVKVLPLGLTNGAMCDGEIVRVGERSLAWSFAGTLTAARAEMLSEFRHVGPNRTYWYDLRKQETPPLDRAAFKALLSDSMFSPCPMGNVVMETFRVYESLEMGCIPLLVQRRRMPYYDRLLPGHQMPSFRSWSEARSFVEQITRDPERLACLQNSVHGWWQSYKAELRLQVRGFVGSGMEGRYTDALARGWRYRTGLRHQAWQITELVRHGSPASLTERAIMTAKRLTGGRLTAGTR